MSNLWFFRLKRAEQQRRRSSGEQSVGSASVQSAAGVSASSLPVASSALGHSPTSELGDYNGDAETCEPGGHNCGGGAADDDDYERPLCANNHHQCLELDGSGGDNQRRNNNNRTRASSCWSHAEQTGRRRTSGQLFGDCEPSEQDYLIAHTTSLLENHSQSEQRDSFTLVFDSSGSSSGSQQQQQQFSRQSQRCPRAAGSGREMHLTESLHHSQQQQQPRVPQVTIIRSDSTSSFIPMSFNGPTGASRPSAYSAPISSVEQRPISQRQQNLRRVVNGSGANKRQGGLVSKLNQATGNVESAIVGDEQQQELNSCKRSGIHDQLISGQVPPIQERLLNPGGGLSLADSIDNLASLIPRVRVEFYNRENTLKEQLQMYFIKDHTVSLYVRAAKLILKVLACYLYVCRVILDRGPAHANCYGCQSRNGTISSGVGASITADSVANPQSLSKFDSYDGPINFRALFWVDRGPVVWTMQTTIAVICFLEAILMQHLTYKNSIFSIVSFHFTMELVTNTPFIISIFWKELRTLFVPGFLNCWLAKQCLEAMLNDLSIVRQSSVLSHRLTILSATVFCLIFTSACGFQHTQRSGGRNYITIFESIYFVVVTFSTVGYGDFKPETWPSQLFIMVMICVALIALPTQFEKLAYFWIERKKLGASYAHHSTRHEKHVVVCSTTLRADTIMDFLNEFYAHPLLQIFSVVLLSPCELDTTMKLVLQTPTWNNRVVYIQGSALKAGDLIRARMQSAEACFILAARNYNDRSAADEHTILRSWAIRDFSPYVPQYVQIFRTENKIHVAFAEHVVCDDEFKYALLANNCLIPGTSTLVTLLLHTSQQRPHRRRRRGKKTGLGLAGLVGRLGSLVRRGNSAPGRKASLASASAGVTSNNNNNDANESGCAAGNTNINNNYDDNDNAFDDDNDQEACEPEWKRLYGRCSANEIYHIRLSDSRFFGEYKGKSFTYASFHSHRKFGVALIGVQTDMRGTWPIMLNPGPSYVLKSGDILFYINITKEENSTLMPMEKRQQQQQFQFHHQQQAQRPMPSSSSPLVSGLVDDSGENCGGQEFGESVSGVEPPSCDLPLTGGNSGSLKGARKESIASQGAASAGATETAATRATYIRIESSSPTVPIAPLTCQPPTLQQPTISAASIATSAPLASSPGLPSEGVEQTRTDNNIQEQQQSQRFLSSSNAHQQQQQRNNLPKKHSIADGASIVARSLCSVAGLVSAADLPTATSDSGDEGKPLELQNLAASLLAKRNSSASTTAAIVPGGIHHHHHHQGGSGLGSRNASTLELAAIATGLRKGSNMSITSSKSRDVSPTRLKQVVSGLAVKMKRVKLGKSLTHLTLPRMDYGGSSASSTESFVNARGRRPSIAPVPAMMGESEEHDSDHEREQESYFAMLWQSSSESSPIVKKFVFCTTYVGVSPTLCYMLQKKKPACCLQLVAACEHCPFKNARQYNWPNRCIILASDFASNGIYNFLVPLRAHFHNPSELRPIVLLLERKPSPQFIDAISWFPMVYWMPGSIDSLDDLIKAGINLAHSVVVTNKESTNSAEEDYLADCNTIVAVQTMFKMFQSVGIITELSQSSNMRFMQFRAHDVLFAGLSMANYYQTPQQQQLSSQARGIHRLDSCEGSGAGANSADSTSGARLAGVTVPGDNSSAIAQSSAIRDRIQLRKLHSQYYNKTMGKEVNSHAYKYRLPFAAGNVFSASMLDTLLYQAFVKDYMITMVRLLLGIDQAPGSGFLSSMKITKEDLWIRTYGRLYQRLCSTTCEIPLGIYRTEPLETQRHDSMSFGAFASQQASYEHASEELERLEITNMVKNRLQDLGMLVSDYDDSPANRNNTFSYVIINPNCDIHLREGDIIYLIRPSPIHSRKLFMHRANSVRHTSDGHHQPQGGVGAAAANLAAAGQFGDSDLSNRLHTTQPGATSPAGGIPGQVSSHHHLPPVSANKRQPAAVAVARGAGHTDGSLNEQRKQSATGSISSAQRAAASGGASRQSSGQGAAQLAYGHANDGQQPILQQKRQTSTEQQQMYMKSCLSDGDFTEILIRVNDPEDELDSQQEQRQTVTTTAPAASMQQHSANSQHQQEQSAAADRNRRRSSCSDAEDASSRGPLEL